MDRVRNCCVCLTRNFGHWASEMTLVIVKFRFVPKVRRNSVLCSREISLKRPWIVTRTFARTFLESSRKQRTKFAHFACVTFAQYCIWPRSFNQTVKCFAWRKNCLSKFLWCLLMLSYFLLQGIVLCYARVGKSLVRCLLSKAFWRPCPKLYLQLYLTQIVHSNSKMLFL